MTLIARLLHSAPLRILMGIACILSLVNWGPVGLAVIMFGIAPIHFWAKRKAEGYYHRNPPCPKVPTPVKIVSYEKPVPKVQTLVKARKFKQRRHTSSERYGDMLSTLSKPMMQLIYDGLTAAEQRAEISESRKQPVDGAIVYPSAKRGR